MNELCGGRSPRLTAGCKNFFATVAAGFRRGVFGASVITATFSCCCCTSGYAAFVESGGMVVIEAEHFASSTTASGHAWYASNNIAGFVGTAAMFAAPNDGTNISTSVTSTSPGLKYQVQFTRTGTYRFWVRGLGGGDLDNSVHVGVDGQTPQPLHYSQNGVWTWTSTNQVTISSAGLHEINVWMREDGAFVDRILLTTNLTFTPTGNGPAESAQPPIVQIATPAPGSSVPAGTTAAVSVDASDPDGFVATVSFYVDGALVGNDTTPPFGFAWTPPTAGIYQLSAGATDNTGNTVTSSMITVTATTAPAEVGTFIESDGLVVMEAEHFAASTSASGHSWFATNSVAGAVSNSAMRAFPNNGATITANITTTSPMLKYRVQFTRTGTYRFWIRGWAASGSDNSIYIGVDGQSPASLSYSQNGVWVWNSGQVVITNGGQHEINVWMREDGAYVDRLLLTTNTAFVPTGDGPPETAPPAATFRWAKESGRIYVENGGTATLTDIRAALPNAPLCLIDPTNHIWFLDATLMVTDGAKLKLYGTAVGGDVNELRLRSDNSAAERSCAAIDADWGTLDLRNVKVISWDQLATGPDKEYTNYQRAFIRARSRQVGSTLQQSTLNVVNSEIGYLGVRSSDAYGLTWDVVGSGTPPSPPPLMIGNSAEGTQTDIVGATAPNAGRFYAETDMTVTTMVAKVTDISGRYKCAIYADSGGLPGALLRTTVELSNPGGGWNTFPLTAALALTGGQYYWLAIWSDDSNSQAYYTSGGTLRWRTYPYGPSWPNPFGSTDGASFNYCIYATSTNAASGALPAPAAEVTVFGSVNNSYIHHCVLGLASELWDDVPWTGNNIVSNTLYGFNPTAQNTVLSNSYGVDYRWAGTSHRIYVTGPGDATLSEIKAAVPEAPLTLVNAASKIWHLGANLFVENGAKLKLYGPAIGGDVAELRLKSSNTANDDAFVEVRADWGWLDIRNTKITSWDSAVNGPDTETSTYRRAYVRARSKLDPNGVTAHESRMDVINSEICYLGSKNTEAYGLTWKVVDTTAVYLPPGSTNDLFDLVNVYGDIGSSYIHHNYFGVYTYGHFGGRWTTNEVAHNIAYGFDPHDDSDNLVIEGNNVHHNGWHGIIASKRCDHGVMRYNRSWNNGLDLINPHGHGIMLHRSCNDWVVENNQSYNNADTGIAIFASDRTLIRNNICLSNINAGIRLSVGAEENRVDGNEVGFRHRYGLYVFEGNDPPEDEDFGINAGRCQRNVFTNNFVHDYTAEALKVSNADSNTFIKNVFLGSGTIFRFETGTNNLVSGNIVPTDTFVRLVGAVPTNGPVEFNTTTFAGQSRLTLQLDSECVATFSNPSGAIFVSDQTNLTTTVNSSGSRVNVTSALVGVGANTVFTRNLLALPSSGSAQIAITTWVLFGSRTKTWTVQGSSGSMQINYQVGDLSPGTSYSVSRNSVQITTRTANSQGYITFSSSPGSTGVVTYTVTRI